MAAPVQGGDRLDPAVLAAAATLGRFLRPLLRTFAVELAAELQRGSVDASLDQRSTALAELRVSPRRFLAAARAGAFPFTRRGRLVVARRSDVEAWLEGRAVPPRLKRAETPPPSADDQVRAALGLRLVGGTSGGRGR